MNKIKTLGSIPLLVIMLLSVITPLTSTVVAGKDTGDIGITAFTLQRTDLYTPFTFMGGVIEKDRNDYMSATGYDIANHVFQGPGVLTNAPSVGYMKDIYINITKAGTLYYLNYTRADDNWWLPIFDPDSKATFENSAGWTPGEVQTNEPLEGWAIAYELEANGYYDKGYLIMTYSGFNETKKNLIYDLDPAVIGFEIVRVYVNGSWHWLPADQWNISVAEPEVLVDNPRLFVVRHVINATNLKMFDYALNDPANLLVDNVFKPTFQITVVVVFNKATKFVEVWTKADLVNIENFDGKVNITYKFQLSRMAIFESNPACDWAFYGWKFLNITYNESIDPTVFITLSYINKTLTDSTSGWWDNNYDYYAAYMLAYPVIPENITDGTVFTFAIASVLPKDETGLYPPTASPSFGYDLWTTPFITLDPNFRNAAWLNMHNTSKKPLGDQALVRYEWFKQGIVEGAAALERTMDIDWKLTMYGVYDVNETYWGGEAGLFDNGQVTLSNGTVITPADIATLTVYPHNGTLGYLNDIIDLTELIAVEDFLSKTALVPVDGVPTNVTIEWLPTEELLWQLYFKFAPPTACKLPQSCVANGTIKWDFLVAGAPGLVTDALGAAWLNARLSAHLVLFDVNASSLDVRENGISTPNKKLTPFIMLLKEDEGANEVYADRKAHYLFGDRALPQMWYRDEPATPWRDVHYLAITVAGPYPNLMTYYANDFIPVVLPIGKANFVLLPYGVEVPFADYAGSDKDEGLGVVGFARDHFNNMILVVYGLDPQDTYWTAWYVYNNFEELPCDVQGMLIHINYTSQSVFDASPGDRIPIADPNFPTVNGVPEISVAAENTDYFLRILMPAVVGG